MQGHPQVQVLLGISRSAAKNGSGFIAYEQLAVQAMARHEETRHAGTFDFDSIVIARALRQDGPACACAGLQQPRGDLAVVGFQWINCHLGRNQKVQVLQ